ncbi:uncharacterized protein METZ01_LOCUS447625, partial [marine metagenome]
IYSKLFTNGHISKGSIPWKRMIYLRDRLSRY